jgi:hypothetical protein
MGRPELTPQAEGRRPPGLIPFTSTLTIDAPALRGSDLEFVGGRAEADPHLPKQVGLVLGHEVHHHNFVGGGDARVLEDDAEPGQEAAVSASQTSLKR